MFALVYQSSYNFLSMPIRVIATEKAQYQQKQWACVGHSASTMVTAAKTLQINEVNATHAASVQLYNHPICSLVMFLQNIQTKSHAFRVITMVVQIHGKIYILTLY